jgi:hypothetical protein
MVKEIVRLYKVGRKESIKYKVEPDKVSEMNTFIDKFEIPIRILAECLCVNLNSVMSN